MLILAMYAYIHLVTCVYLIFRGQSTVVLKPKTTTQISQILKHCNERKLVVKIDTLMLRYVHINIHNVECTGIIDGIHALQQRINQSNKNEFVGIDLYYKSLNNKKELGKEIYKSLLLSDIPYSIKIQRSKTHNSVLVGMKPQFHKPLIPVVYLHKRMIVFSATCSLETNLCTVYMVSPNHFTSHIKLYKFLWNCLQLIYQLQPRKTLGCKSKRDM